MKLFKKFLAAAVAFTMALFTFATVTTPTPTYALNGTTGTPAEVPIQKTWNKPAGGPVPQAPVVFNVAPVTIPANAQIGYGGMPLVTGIAGGFDATYTIAAPANNTTNQAATTLTATTTISPHANVFTHAGLYRYEVTEAAPTLPGLAPTPGTPTKYYVDVFVENDTTTGGGVHVQDIMVFDATNGLTTGAPKANQISFENTFTTYDLTFTESTVGTGADMTKQFEYTLNIVPASPDAEYVIETTIGGTTTSTTVKGAITDRKFNLGNGDKVVVKGLAASDTYTIAETNPATEGYLVNINQTAGGQSTYPQGTLSVTGSPTANTSYTFVNSRTSTVPTAFFTTYGPYVAGIVVLGGLGYAMFRKKKINE